MSVTSAGEGDLAAKQLGSEAASRSVYPSKSSLIEGRLMLQEVAHDNNFNLTETVYSQFTTHHSLKKAAFTLAEVLITLGIIGVVAAITLPTLIKNYQKQVYVTLLKQDVSILENSFKRILANNETDNLNNTPLYDGTNFNKDYFISQTNFNDISNNSTIEFVKSVKKLTKNDLIFYLNNGSCIAVESKPLQGNQYLYIDVNCDKSTNKIGYDQFRMSFKLSGNVYVSTSSPCFINNIDKKYASLGSSVPVSLIYGTGCFSRIIKAGWKMNY